MIVALAKIRSGELELKELLEKLSDVRCKANWWGNLAEPFSKALIRVYLGKTFSEIRWEFQDDLPNLGGKTKYGIFHSQPARR